MDTFHRAGMHKVLRRAILMSCWEMLYIAISRTECDYLFKMSALLPHACIFCVLL